MHGRRNTGRDAVAQLGEGPTYDPAQDKAWWFDIVGKRLLQHDFAAATTTIHELPLMASMLGVIDERTQLLATENGLYIRDTATGGLTLHQPLEADNPATRSNDGRVHPSGAIWIGTMGKQAEQAAGAIYWFFKGELRKLYPEISIPNSICFSPDGGTAYFTDTRVAKLMAVRGGSGQRSAARRTSFAVRLRCAEKRAGWLGRRCRRRNLECVLGCLAYQCHFTARCAFANPAGPGAAAKLSRLHWPRSRATARHLRMAGHGRRPARRGPTCWQDLRSRRRCARPGRAAGRSLGRMKTWRQWTRSLSAGCLTDKRFAA